MKYVKTYETAIKWYYKGKLDKDEDFQDDSPIEIGDWFLVKDELYEKYPNWTLWFKQFIEEKKPLKVDRIVLAPEGNCLEVRQGYYLPPDMAIKYHPENEAVKWYNKGKFERGEESLDKQLNEEPIKVGDFVVVTDELYEKYPNWAESFKKHIKNGTPLKVIDKRVNGRDGDFECVFFDLDRDFEGFYVPIDTVVKYKLLDEATIRWYYKGKLEKDPDDIDEFKVGDHVVLVENFYNRTAEDDINSRLINGDEKNIKNYQIDPKKITRIEEYDGVKMMKLATYYPWYLCSQWKLSDTNEKVKWYYKGKLEEEPFDNNFTKEFEVGSYVVLSEDIYHRTRSESINSELVTGDRSNVDNYKRIPKLIKQISEKNGEKTMKLEDLYPWYVCNEWKLSLAPWELGVQENVNSDIDPYNEENWGNKSAPNNLYVIYVIGQDMNFLAAKKERPVGRWKDYYYTIATKRNGEIHFNGANFEANPYPAHNIDDILNGKELVGYLTGPLGNTTSFDTLQNLCNMMEIPIEAVHMLKG